MTMMMITPTFPRWHSPPYTVNSPNSFAPGAVRVWSQAAAASHPSAAHVHHVAFTDGSGGHGVVVVDDGEEEVRVQLQ
jgi:hypothetical protein